MFINNYGKFLFLVFILASHSNLLSQETFPKISFTNISVTEGLSNNYINDITQDSFGFIWVGTTDGLCRYDSKDDFKIYQKGGELDIKSSNIRALLVDSKNKLWIGTRLGGLTCYDQETRTSKTYQSDKNDHQSISNDEILSITEDSKGRIWVGTEIGLNLFNPKTDSFFSWEPNDNDENTLPNKAVLTIFEDSRGLIWVGTWSGGLSLILNSNQSDPASYSFRNFTMDESVASANVWSILEDHKNRLWIGSHGGGIFLLDIPPAASNIPSEQTWEFSKIE